MDATRYLEEARIEELAARFSGNHFDVVTHPTGEDQGYDLLAKKGDRVIAIQVKAGGKLGAAARDVSQLRNLARARGYEYRLEVVNPPREVKVDVEGLRDEIRRYLEEHPPADLARLGPIRSIEDVYQVELDRIKVASGLVSLSGAAIVDVQVAGPEGSKVEEDDARESIPIRFDVTLGDDLRIREAREMRLMGPNPADPG